METYIFILALMTCSIFLIPIYSFHRLSFLLLSCFTESLINNIDRLPNGYTKIELRNICLLSFFIITISTSMFFLILSESNYILTSVFIFAILLFQYYSIIYFEKKLPIHIIEYIKSIKKSKLFEIDIFLLKFSNDFSLKEKNEDENSKINDWNELENIKSSIIEEFVKIKNPYIRLDRNISNLNFEEICNEFGIDVNCKEVIKDKISGVETPKKIVFNGINHKGFEKEPIVLFFIKYFNIVEFYKKGKIKYVNNNRQIEVLEFINDNIYFENFQAKDKFKKELTDSDFSKYVKKYFETLGK
ncbi:hypothetical protein [Empedobacter sp. 189-2]|uniref:hypothetical protein n=1 Tax=Empedobacter sp. 189-2 TaxID=2746724 RepID=UPI002578C7D0|nr:hypothetical protein [Empedobacter sp. 189-2]MDM1543276.1 hypothetical protein [Empedobacter sp. 189-2]